MHTITYKIDTNKDLLYTGNSTQYWVMMYMAKELEREWMCGYIYVCVTELLCCTPESNTTLSINYTPT